MILNLNKVLKQYFHYNYTKKFIKLKCCNQIPVILCINLKLKNLVQMSRKINKVI